MALGYAGRTQNLKKLKDSLAYEPKGLTNRGAVGRELTGTTHWRGPKGLTVRVDGLKDSLAGASWGGFESLVMLCFINRIVHPWSVGEGRGATLRLSVGLEDVRDLLRDLENAFQALAEAKKTSPGGK